MTSFQNLPWSRTEKTIARRAFDKAYRKECEAIVQKAKAMIANVKVPRDLWRVQEYLHKQREMLDEKYDFR